MNGVGDILQVWEDAEEVTVSAGWAVSCLKGNESRWHGYSASSAVASLKGFEMTTP